MAFGRDQVSNYGVGHGGYSVSKETSIEDVNWRDTGCSLHPSCLNCPRTVCRYDEEVSHGGQRRASILATVPDLRGLVDSIGARAVAEIYGIGRRSVFRELARRRNESH